MGSRQAVIAVGGNLGDRLANVRESLKLMESYGLQVFKKSRLYETAPELVTDQPAFLNAAVALETELPPRDLLRSLKLIEVSTLHRGQAALGRDFAGQRYGPRPVDLDIIFYDDQELVSDDLTIPHERWQERAFVQAPLADLFAPSELLEKGGICSRLKAAQSLWDQQGGEGLVGREGLQAVLPMGCQQEWLWPWRQRTQVMAILNLTPDSFSDGGQVVGAADAVAAARQAVALGADMLDVGGQSTRPNATRLSAAEECSRIIPAIRAMAGDQQLKGIPLSVDTFQAEVAAQAVAAGAHMVNDVSGGTLDPAMHSQVAELGVPYVLMHMRGDPTTMQQSTHTSYTDVCAEVGQELQAAADKAIAAGIEPWSIILDPGIGFAKTAQGNCQLIQSLPRVRQQLQSCLRNQPLLAGPSRKGFLGKLTGRQAAADRDVATAAAASLCIQGGAGILRVHNTGAGRDAALVADGICRAGGVLRGPA